MKHMCVMHSKLLQSYSILCDAMDHSLPGPSLEWVAMLFCRGSSNPGIEPTPLLSHALAVEFFATVPPGKPWNIIYCHNFKYYYSYMVFYNNDILKYILYIYMYHLYKIYKYLFWKYR